MNSAAPVQKKSIRFRARSFVVFTLTPEAPSEKWLQRLDRWTEKSPGFFSGRPIVLDLNGLKPELGEIPRLVSQLADRGIRVYAIEAEGVDALGPDLPPLLVGAKSTTAREPYPSADPGAAPAASPAAEEALASTSLMVRSPIRSGQSIFHPQGDVIVLGSAASGSEIIAAGSVHIYGTLRGRVFAGATGNRDARIFCRKNEAELIAVDGVYRTADDMEPSSRGRPVQAFLENGVVRVAALN